MKKSYWHYWWDLYGMYNYWLRQVQVLQEVLKVRQPVAQMRRLMPDRQISRRIKALPAKRKQ